MRRMILYGALVLTLVAVLANWSEVRAQAGLIAEQVLSNTVYNGATAQGAGVLQVGQVDTLSAAVASGTLTQVVAAPAAGKIYVRAVLVEKVSATPTFTLKYGTGTNCGTGTTTILGPVTPTGNRVNLDIKLPVAAKALCAQTDGATTGIRVLAQ